MLKRKIYEYLINWKKESNKAPLVVKGLRQVGKTYIVKEFAKNNYENAYIFDFRKNPSLSLLFKGDFDIENLIISVSALPDENRLIKNSKMVPYKTILIFDEVQDCQNARSSLKYFKEDGRFDVICTGSLLGIEGYRLSKKISRGIAVGSEEQIKMYPMDFEEFLWALNIDDSLIKSIKDSADNIKKVPEFIHYRILELIKQYICIGGMPEAVLKFLETKDLTETRKIQKRLINNYKSDFGIHLDDSNELVVDNLEKTKIMDVFNSIPKQLAKDNKKFQYVTINKKAKARTHEDAIKWLKNYGLIDICYNLSTIEEPFDFFTIKDQFKIYISDIGLLTAMLEDDMPNKILTDDLGIGKGIIYENLIAETLLKMNKPLYYFYKDSGLEIDFISKIYSKPYIIEVKAKSGNTKSSKTVLNNPNYKVDNLLKLTKQNVGNIDNILTIPYYLSFYILNK